MMVHSSQRVTCHFFFLKLGLPTSFVLKVDLRDGAGNISYQQI